MGIFGNGFKLEPWMQGMPGIGGMMPDQGGMQAPQQDYLPGVPSGGELQGQVNQTLAQPAPKKKGGFFKPGMDHFDFTDILGILGDALSGQGGYANAMQQYRKGKQDEDQYQRRRGDDLEDYEAKQEIDKRFAAPKQRRTVEVDGIILDADTMQPLYESPYPKIFQGPEGFYEIPRLGLGRGQPQAQTPSGGDVTATNPQTGQKVRLNPQTGQWEPVGGASPSSGSGGFPGPY